MNRKYLLTLFFCLASINSFAIGEEAGPAGDEQLAEIDALDALGDTQLIDAIIHERIERVIELIEAGANINIPNARGFTPLMVAAITGNGNIVAILVDEDNIEIDTTTSNGMSAITLAAAHRTRINALEELIRAGANLNTADNEGYTPLTMAVTQKNGRAISRLLNAGADFTIKNVDGHTALEIAEDIMEDQSTSSVIRVWLEKQTLNIPWTINIDAKMAKKFSSYLPTWETLRKRLQFRPDILELLLLINNRLASQKGLNELSSLRVSLPKEIWLIIFEAAFKVKDIFVFPGLKTYKDLGKGDDNPPPPGAGSASAPLMGF